MSARLTPESSAGWEQFTSFHGVSFSAVVEAAGRLLNEHRTPFVEPQSIVDLARQIDAERLKRR